MLCVLGGIIGIAVGSGTAIGACYWLHWNTAVSLDAVVAAFVFSALVGVVFSVWPARRAASLDPIMALHYE